MDIIIYIFVFMLGASFISFFQLIVDRNFNKSCLTGNSVCDNCGNKLTLLDVFPVFSILFHKRKCRYCGYNVPIKYFYFEVLGGISLLIIYIFVENQVTAYIEVLVAFFVLWIVSLYDLKYQLVKDRIWVTGFIALSILRVIDSSLAIHLLSSIIMFLALLFLAIISEKVFKKEALGGGDIKLYLFIGMVLNLPIALLSLFLASVFGLIYAMIKKSKSDTYLPLVPFISLSVFVSYFWGYDLINWYLSLLGI